MNRLFIITATMAAAMTLFSCSAEKSPIEEAIRKQIEETNPGVKGFSISELQVTETVSFGNELEHAMSIFKAKEKIERGRYEKATEERKPKTAATHLEKAESSRLILESLEEYKIEHEASLDSILYHVVSFKLSMNTGRKRETLEKYAAIGPDFKVYNIVSGITPKAGMTATMPGYKALLQSLRASEEEE